MRKRKINLLIVSQDSSAFGGAEVLLTFLAKEFSKKNIKVSVLTNCKPFLEAQKKGVAPIYVPFRVDIIGNLRGFIKFIFQLIPALFWYGKIIRSYSKEGDGLVLISGFSEKLIVTPLAMVYNLPVLWLEHGPLEELFNRNLGIPGMLYKLMEKKVSRIVTPSENTKEHIIKEANIRKEKITVIHNGIELKSEKEIKVIKKNASKLEKELNIDNKHFLVGMVSRLQIEKGQDTMIDAMRILNKRNSEIKLIIAGEGPDLDKYRKITKKHNLEKHIEFTDYISDQRKWQLYSLFNVFSFPTRWELEGFGIVLLEAMMMGVPVIASDFGPVPEVVGDAGLLVKPNAESFSRAIMMLKKDSKMQKELVEKGKQRVKEFDIKITAEKYVDAFEVLYETHDKNK